MRLPKLRNLQDNTLIKKLLDKYKPWLAWHLKLAASVSKRRGYFLAQQFGPA
jgi:hypothetical protein